MTEISREDTLRLVLQLAMPIPGNIVEFGVADGGSTRVLQGELNRHQRGRISGPRKAIFACDSFEGLPEGYENAAPGAFAQDGVPHIPGVRIVQGYFDHSLTPELAKEVGSVALASLDADLYSSTMTALRWLTPLLHTGSLLLFDEYIGEDESEKRAHDEWARETGVETVTLAEFRREPSGWGTAPDLRVLRQVVGRGEPETVPLLTVEGAARKAASEVKRRIRDRDFSWPATLRP